MSRKRFTPEQIITMLREAGCSAVKYDDILWRELNKKQKEVGN